MLFVLVPMNMYLARMKGKIRDGIGIFFCVNKSDKVQKIQEDSMDSIPSPSVKIYIMGGNVYLIGDKAKQSWKVYFPKFVDITQQCFA